MCLSVHQFACVFFVCMFNCLLVGVLDCLCVFVCVCVCVFNFCVYGFFIFLQVFKFKTTKKQPILFKFLHRNIDLKIIKVEKTI